MPSRIYISVSISVLSSLLDGGEDLLELLVGCGEFLAADVEEFLAALGVGAQIVQKMQDPQCSIDNLSAYTKRSKELLDICRKKLTAADEQLKQILADIQQQ